LTPSEEAFLRNYAGVVHSQMSQLPQHNIDQGMTRCDCEQLNVPPKEEGDELDASAEPLPPPFEWAWWGLMDQEGESSTQSLPEQPCGGAVGLTAEGLTAEGHTAEGLTAEGLTAEGLTAEGHTAEGHTAEGHTAEGLVGEGLAAEGLAGEGLSAEGLSAEGLSAEGLTAEGLSAEGLTAEGPLSGRSVPREAGRRGSSWDQDAGDGIYTAAILVPHRVLVHHVHRVRSGYRKGVQLIACSSYFSLQSTRNMAVLSSGPDHCSDGVSSVCSPSSRPAAASSELCLYRGEGTYLLMLQPGYDRTAISDRGVKLIPWSPDRTAVCRGAHRSTSEVTGLSAVTSLLPPVVYS
ncbi:unnamed protein product, partial [Arctogadus glacialis]